MKNVIIVALLLCTSCLYSQDSCFSSIAYKEAYRYIKKAMPSKRVVCVSNHIVSLDTYVMSELDLFPEMKKELQNLKEEQLMSNKYINSYCKVLDDLFPKPTKAEAIIYFSKMEGRILRADLMILNRQVSRLIDFDSAACLGLDNTYSYLFFFKQDGSIEKSFFYEMHYEAIGPVLFPN